MLTVEEVAAILKVQPLTVRQMFRESRIRGFKIGKAWRTTQIIPLEQGEKAAAVVRRWLGNLWPTDTAGQRAVWKCRAQFVPLA